MCKNCGGPMHGTFYTKGDSQGPHGADHLAGKSASCRSCGALVILGGDTVWTRVD